MTGHQQQISTGYSIGSSMMLLAIIFGGLAFWIFSQVAGFIVGAISAVAILAAFGLIRDLKDGLPVATRGLLSLTDTRDRVLAMEEYHGIDYIEVPGERFYLKEGERAELIIYNKAGRKRKTKAIYRASA